MLFKMLKEFTLIFSLTGLVLLLATSGLAHAQASQSRTQQIMASFILHFTSFVEWPDNAEPTVNVCIVGRDPFGQFIDDMRAARPTNRKGEIISVFRMSAGEDVHHCHLIFATEESTTSTFWQALPEEHSILLVSNYDRYTREGGLINFYKENKHVRIEINMREVDKAGLEISSELLKLSKITHYKNSRQSQ